MEKQADDWKTATDWVTVAKVLLGFLHTRYGFGPTSTILGLSPEDIVQELIAKTLAGTRSYNPSHPLIPWLRLELKSEVDNLLKRSGAKLEVGLDVREPSGVEAVEKRSIQSREFNTDLVESSPDGEQLALNRDLEEEERQRQDHRISAIYKAVDDDPLLQEVLDAIRLNNIEPTPRALAACLNISIPEANRRLRNLRRRAEKITSQQTLRSQQ